jgi:pantoate--beta-alanine ligase
MKVVKTIKEMQVLGRRFRSAGKTIGLVPTMGALHEGHLSLVRQSIHDNDRTVASIFVNPAQFGPAEDFNTYPRDTDEDFHMLSELGVYALFLPDNEEMYPDGFSISVHVGDIGDRLCGKSRPGHFNGVATVVAKLFNVIRPDRAYFGQKDHQQTVVIKKMVREMNFDIDITECPVVRETDGLAMSSRNRYLNHEERKAAVVLSRALRLGREMILVKEVTDPGLIKKAMEGVISSEDLAESDYIEIVDSANLLPLSIIENSAAICIAVYIGKTRLIDNIIVK